MPKKFVEETITVAVFVGTGKVWIRKGEYQDFPSKIFCLTLPKNFAGESITVAVFLGTGKFWIKKGDYQSLRRNFFVSQYRKLSWGNLSVFHYFRVSKNSMLQRFMSEFSVENF